MFIHNKNQILAYWCWSCSINIPLSATLEKTFCIGILIVMDFFCQKCILVNMFVAGTTPHRLVLAPSGRSYGTFFCLVKFYSFFESVYWCVTCSCKPTIARGANRPVPSLQIVYREFYSCFIALSFGHGGMDAQ